MTEMMLTEDASEKLSKDIAEHELKMKKSAKANKKKSMNKYKIFYVETDEKTGIEKKVTMKKFYAKDDDEAYELLKKYRKIANP